MILYRSAMKSSGGRVIDHSKDYTHTIDGVLQQGSCAGMFVYNHIDSNTPVVIGDNVVTCYRMFVGKPFFNAPVIIGNNVTNCDYMFAYCNNFNQSVVIPNGVTNANSMFMFCRMDAKVTIPASILDTETMFCKAQFSDENFPVFPPDFRGNSLAFTFDQIGKDDSNASNSHIYNLNYYIPKNVNNLYWAFCGTKICGNLYINNAYFVQENMLGESLTGTHRLNVYCNDSPRGRNSSSVIGKNIVFTSMTNGWYNEYYNLYWYTNYKGT